MPAPATEYVSPGGKPFAVRCEDRPDFLYAVVTGPKGDTDVGVALWRVLAGEVQKRGSRGLLVESRLTGTTLSPQGLARVIAHFVGSPLEGVRIAYLENEARNVPAMEHGAIAAAEHVPAMEHGQIFAAEQGFNARVFGEIGAADRWLRLG
jgi:hypothetical protein